MTATNAPKVKWKPRIREKERDGQRKSMPTGNNSVENQTCDRRTFMGLAFWLIVLALNGSPPFGHFLECSVQTLFRFGSITYKEAFGGRMSRLIK